MSARVQLIDSALIEETVRRAQQSPRRRINHNFHRTAAENPHRFLNVILRGSYVAPHRHLAPPKCETFLVIEGSVALFCFDDQGSVTERYLLGAVHDAAPGWRYGGLGLDLAPGVWHSVAAVSGHAVCFEVKPGPWDPATDKEFAPWAPIEGEPAAEGYLQQLLDSGR